MGLALKSDRKHKGEVAGCVHRVGIGDEIYTLIEKLYPICRSITGDGVRETLEIMREYIPLDIREVPSSTKVFDWVVPKEWNIRDAYVKNSRGKRIIDFQGHNLHVVSYSAPVNRVVPLAELKDHLFSLPEHPAWIPYRTSYYNETWGFCVSQEQLEQLTEKEYEVCIDSTLEEGSLTYAEYFLPGEIQDEVLIFTHLCHPSLCNDNLSGISLVTHLAKHLAAWKRRYSYRFVFAPGTIGSITWLSENRTQLDQIKHGLVVALVGDDGPFTYKRSRRGDAEIDRVARHVLRHSGEEAKIVDFVPFGYDERQFCSPGINLPVGRLTRTPNGCYPEYHTSADNLAFVRPERLSESFSQCLKIFRVLEQNRYYENTNPMCEPQLGRRGLYRTTGGTDIPGRELALLWVLNMSDGEHSLLDVAELAGMDFDVICSAAGELLRAGLLSPC